VFYGGRKKAPFCQKEGFYDFIDFGQKEGFYDFIDFIIN